MAALTHGDKAALKALKLPDIFKEHVNLKYVNMTVIRKHIEDTLSKILPDGDDISLVQFLETLNANSDDKLDPRLLQLQLTEIIDAKAAAAYCEELWKLLLSAQASKTGVPRELVDAKVADLRKAQSNGTNDKSDEIDNNAGRYDNGSKPTLNLQPPTQPTRTDDRSSREPKSANSASSYRRYPSPPRYRRERSPRRRSRRDSPPRTRYRDGRGRGGHREMPLLDSYRPDYENDSRALARVCKRRNSSSEVEGDRAAKRRRSEPEAEKAQEKAEKSKDAE